MKLKNMPKSKNVYGPDPKVNKTGKGNHRNAGPMVNPYKSNRDRSYEGRKAISDHFENKIKGKTDKLTRKKK